MTPALIKKLRVPGAPGDEVPRKEALLMNPDLVPVDPPRRKWTAWSYVAFWVSDGLNINTWMISSGAIQAGLSWWQAWLAVWLGYTIVALFLVASARPGARYHIGFPVLTRASWGPWGSFWPVLNRAVMACVWTGVQTYIGGECLGLVIRSIWPSYARLHNGIPLSVGVTTQQFVSFFLFWVIQLPFIYVRPESIRWLFYTKSVAVPIAAFAFFGWTIADAGGLGPIVHQKSAIKGSVLAWAFVGALMDCISNFATLIVNICDFARVAKTPGAVTYSQLFTVPLTFAITSFIGIIVSSASQPIWGEFIWNPLDILARRLDDNPYGGGVRAGVFFIAAAFVLAQIGLNIAANTLSAGSDLCALLPRYISIRRGGFVAAIVALCMQPWQLVSSGSRFGTYLGAYSLFLSSIAGVILSDYYVVRRGLLNYRSLYSAEKDSLYRYTYGVNPRAIVAYLCGLAPNIPGFAGVCGATVSDAAKHIYTVAYFPGFFVAAIVYVILSTVFPVPDAVNIRSKEWREPADGDDVNDSTVGFMRPDIERKATDSSIEEGSIDKKIADDDEMAYMPTSRVQPAQRAW